jgi:hypothetical protein
VKSPDVTRAVREQLIALKVYAEINFDFVGSPYTIARAKEPTAPFTAVNVKCSVVFHDVESDETKTGSGLGSGCDTSDKAVYKAQTGALKYALKNSCLIPDEAGKEMDPEADESVDENTQPHAPRAAQARPAPRAAAARPARSAVNSARPTPAPATASTSAAAAPNTVREPGDDEEAFHPAMNPADPTMPTEEQMNVYRTTFQTLGNDLTSETGGDLKSSPRLPVERKILIFMLRVTGAPDAVKMTTAQWDNFFQRVDAMAGPADKRTTEGLVNLAKLINKTNGIEEKAKK